MKLKPSEGPNGRGVWRGVYSSLVDHPDYQMLTPGARLVLLTLRLGTLNSIASIFRLYLDVLRQQTGLSPDDVDAALRELEVKPSSRRPWLVRDGDGVAWIRNGLKFDPSVTTENENHVKALRRAVHALPRSSPVVKRFLRQYKALRLESHPPSDGASHGQWEGGITSTSSTPNPTKITSQERRSGGEDSTVAGGAASPSPAGAGFVGAGNGLKGQADSSQDHSAVRRNSSRPGTTTYRRPAPHEWAETLELVRAQYPELSDSDAKDRALVVYTESLARSVTRVTR